MTELRDSNRPILIWLDDRPKEIENVLAMAEGLGFELYSGAPITDPYEFKKALEDILRNNRDRLAGIVLDIFIDGNIDLSFFDINGNTNASIGLTIYNAWLSEALQKSFPEKQISVVIYSVLNEHLQSIALANDSASIHFVEKLQQGGVDKTEMEKLLKIILDLHLSYQ